MPMTDEEKIRFTNDLYSIKNDTKGKDVKDSIHDALTLVGKYSGEGGGGGSEPVNATAKGNLAGEYLLGDAEQTPLPPYPKLFAGWQETNDNTKTSATLTATATANAMLVVAVMYRGNTINISGDGWTRFLDTTAIDSNQRVVIWTKTVTSGSYQVTVTQDQKVRLSMKMFVIYKCSGLTIVDNVITSDYSHIPTLTTGKRRLYLGSITYGVTSGSTPSITATNYSGLDLISFLEVRFSAFYDYQPELEITPTLEQNQGGNWHAITLDIEEE